LTFNMGYNNSANTLTLTAKLTPIGRQRFATNSGKSLITSFSLGDSDANYYASLLLSSGQVPAEAGEVGPYSTASNSTTSNASLKSALIVNGNGVLTKLIESKSSRIGVDIVSNGQTTITASNLKLAVINRQDFNTDSLVNLFYSFGLPITAADDTIYTGVTFSNGGYSDTALSGLSQNKILTVAINNSTYGELLDGKQIKMILPTTAGTFTIYSTFQNKGANKQVEDANYRDTSPVAAKIDSNVAMLFCDTISKPNSDTHLSWATGFGLNKPFSLSKKQFYNLQTNSNTSTTADTVVGVAYLDKGFIVITHPTIVNAYSTAVGTGTSVTFNSISTSIIQNVTCIADRGEFGGSTNPTFGPSDTPRISEVALYDELGNVIAIAKTDRHISKGINQFMAFGVNINL
jgi:hypothetical protein